MGDSIQTPPPPFPMDDQPRCREQAQRYRVLTGDWKDDARERQSLFFNRETLAFLPPPDISRNAFLQIMSQTATLYDSPPEVRCSPPAEDLEALSLETLWPTLQELLLLTRGVRECLLRLDWTPEGVGYRVVPAHLVCQVVADPDRPDQPISLRELRPRLDPTTQKTVWTWEEWSIAHPKAKTETRFRILQAEAAGASAEVDVTSLYYDGPGYPYQEGGQPIFPYVLYHESLGPHLWSYQRGREVIDGTLTESAYWTMWGSGLRDNAHAQRVLIDGDVQGGGQAKTTKGGVRHVEANPAIVLNIASKGDRQASIGQWSPALDPKDAGEAIEAWAAGLAIHAGLAPSELQRGSQASSGYAIVVSRDGQRRVQARIAPVCRRSDQLTLARAARFARAYAVGAAALPIDPKAWSVKYATLGKSLEERRQEREEALENEDKGLTSRIDTLMALYGYTREQALEHEARVRTDAKTIQEATGKVVQENPYRVGDVTSAIEIAVKVSSGELTPAAAQQLLETVIGLQPQQAESLAVAAASKAPPGQPVSAGAAGEPGDDADEGSTSELREEIQSAIDLARELPESDQRADLLETLEDALAALSPPGRA